jgi:hypothetical protein
MANARRDNPEENVGPCQIETKALQNSGVWERREPLGLG